MTALVEASIFPLFLHWNAANNEPGRVKTETKKNLGYVQQFYPEENGNINFLTRVKCYFNISDEKL